MEQIMGQETGCNKEEGQEKETKQDMTIEETFAALDALIDRMEKGDGSLEDAFQSYEEGMKLIKRCNEKIERIERQILVLGKEQTEEEEHGNPF